MKSIQRALVYLTVVLFWSTLGFTIFPTNVSADFATTCAGYEAGIYVGTPPAECANCTINPLSTYTQCGFLNCHTAAQGAGDHEIFVRPWDVYCPDDNSQITWFNCDDQGEKEYCCTVNTTNCGLYSEPKYVNPPALCIFPGKYCSSGSCQNTGTNSTATGWQCVVSATPTSSSPCPCTDAANYCSGTIYTQSCAGGTPTTCTGTKSCSCSCGRYGQQCCSTTDSSDPAYYSYSSNCNLGGSLCSEGTCSDSSSTGKNGSGRCQDPNQNCKCGDGIGASCCGDEWRVSNGETSGCENIIPPYRSCIQGLVCQSPGGDRCILFRVQGNVFVDDNGNGVWDTTTEPGYQAARLDYLGGTGKTQTMYSQSSGFYEVTGINNSYTSHRVTLTVPPGYTATTATNQTYTVSSDQYEDGPLPDINFGIKPYNIGGYVKNKNTGGGIAGVQVGVKSGADVWSYATTDSNGFWKVSGFIPIGAAYAVRVIGTTPSGYTPPAKTAYFRASWFYQHIGWSWQNNSGSGSRNCSDPSTWNDGYKGDTCIGESSYENQIAGMGDDCAGTDDTFTALRCSFTYDPVLSVSGMIFIDTDRDGIKDVPAEQNYPGSLSLVVASNNTSFTQSIYSTGGSYTTGASIPPGSYTLYLTMPAGYSASTPNPQTVNLTTSNATVDFGIQSVLPPYVQTTGDVHSNQ